MSDKLAETTEDDNSVTMLDVLQVENQLEEDAYAVLGASDDQNCTYNKGYMRQALYACKTCSNKTRAAVCLACSFHCHEGHELVELYTKRHFRCDCGSSKFEGKQCNLEKQKSATNGENKYNQNFDGVYCTCARPYPDPEGDDDEMLQCIICEDWYHSKHLEVDSVPAEDTYDEVICARCMREHNFLWRYAAKYAVLGKSDAIADNKIEEVDVCELPKGCQMPKVGPVNTKGSCFWKQGWRTSLCTCDECKSVYSAKDVAFLLDPKDSVQAYEEAGKMNKKESQYEKGMKALASLEHVQQLTAIEEYNNMKERLMQYLQKFAQNKKVVREEDIKEFFSGMESRKRPRVVVPTYCR
ncbi:putative E3 ubiquitin-protein ligase UBR7 isoform X2 [Harpegnathos saltator]|uniref:Putative E3 ubiquitin-protein ligase UBR7 n=2 Tax=Harpegnathos saltator TaxID=610380 RepID=E2BAL9_HARSA|nr:putative E3 ubiquitin-protein ligase UBR7 isoform X2 [Harpegnathos saltator]EFN87245.1 Putative E3 ubiquitin-protein ligase UBR7 [Harpegnathos saltator]